MVPTSCGRPLLAKRTPFSTWLPSMLQLQSTSSCSSWVAPRNSWTKHSHTLLQPLRQAQVGEDGKTAGRNTDGSMRKTVLGQCVPHDVVLAETHKPDTIIYSVFIMCVFLIINCLYTITTISGKKFIPPVHLCACNYIGLIYIYINYVCTIIVCVHCPVCYILCYYSWIKPIYSCYVPTAIKQQKQQTLYQELVIDTKIK